MLVEIICSLNPTPLPPTALPSFPDIIQMARQNWSDLTHDEQHVVLWFTYLVQEMRMRVAQAAIDQYDAWEVDPYSWDVPVGMLS